MFVYLYIHIIIIYIYIYIYIYINLHGKIISFFTPPRTHMHTDIYTHTCMHEYIYTKANQVCVHQCILTKLSEEV